MDTLKNNFLVLDEFPTYAINSSVGGSEQKFSNKFSKEKLHDNDDNRYLFFNGRKYISLRLIKKR